MILHFPDEETEAQRLSNLLEFRHLISGTRQDLNLSSLSLETKPLTESQPKLFNPVHFVKGLTSSGDLWPLFLLLHLWSHH